MDIKKSDDKNKFKQNHRIRRNNNTIEKLYLLNSIYLEVFFFVFLRIALGRLVVFRV